MRLCFRLNAEYDAELIEYLKTEKNKSRGVRKVLRLGLAAMKQQGQNTEKPAKKVVAWKGF